MDMSEYISLLREYKKPDLRPLAVRFLKYIADSDESAYTLSRKAEGMAMAYKNVWLNVKKLQKSGLIEGSKKDQKHGAKYFKISEKGWLYLLVETDYFRYQDKVLDDSSRDPITPERFLNLFKSKLPEKFKHTIIYRRLIEPYFEEITITTLGPLELYFISEYMRDCCAKSIGVEIAFVPLFRFKHADKKDLKVSQLPKADAIGVYSVFFQNVIEDRVKDACLALITPRSGFPQKIPRGKERMLKALRGDAKFMRVVANMRDEFLKRYDEFMKME